MDEKQAAKKVEAAQYKKLVSVMKVLEKKYGFMHIVTWYTRRDKRENLIIQRDSIERSIKNLQD